MRIVHRVGLRASPEQLDALAELSTRETPTPGLPGTVPLLTFDVGEDHPQWPKLAGLFADWGVSDVVRTEFARDELLAACWAEIRAMPRGYPQPREDDFGYLAATYELASRCEACGIGGVQKAGFQMKAEPKWGRAGALQLTWVEDELFVRPELWKQVFEPAGVQCRPVLNRRGEELSDVVQLVVETLVPVDVAGHLTERCARCERERVSPNGRGRFPRLCEEPEVAMARTQQWFGWGAAAWRPLLAHRSIVRALMETKVHGVLLRPTANE